LPAEQCGATFRSPFRQNRANLSVHRPALSDGGDNISAYIPVFSTAGAGGVLTYVLVFLVLLAIWCAAGHFFARRHLVADALSHWGRIVLPVVLIGVGLTILVGGRAFGL
jgi:cadmium resistance protein CadD (predicted permease)